MDKFVLFSTVHLITIVVGFLSCFVLMFLGFIFNKDKLAKTVSVIILGVKIVELVYRHFHYEEKIVELLPLHICNIAMIFAIFMMFFRGKIFFQPVYYWSVLAIFAVATPELKDGILNYASLSFFITHFFIIFSVMYGFVHFSFRPSKSGLINSYLLINLFAIGIYFLNIKLGTNYMYANRPPSTKTLIDILGPWPYYILSVEGVYLVLSFLVYLPFRNRKTKYIK